MDARSEDFKRALVAGDRNVVYPILHHVLSKFRALQKRAYVARFLVNVAVPDEFMHDEVVADVFQHLKERQEEFVEVHKRVDRLVRGALDHVAWRWLRRAARASVGGMPSPSPLRARVCVVHVAPWSLALASCRSEGTRSTRRI